MIYFLSSMPRSGSTLLASLLGQRPDTHVSKTSNLYETLEAVYNVFQTSQTTKAAGCTNDELHRILEGIIRSKYSDIDKKYIFDKDRVWPFTEIMTTMREVQGGGASRIVATVRPMVECIASFYLIDKSTLPIKEWIRTSHLFKHLMDSYTGLKEGYEFAPQNFCIVEYDNLVNDPQKELDRIADFIGMPHVAHKPDIEQVEEFDAIWLVPDLHTLEPKIHKNKMNARAVLGQEIYDHYSGGEFWNDKPEPECKANVLDMILEAGIHGRFEKAERMIRNEIKDRPDNIRAQYNLGLYELMKGNHVRGHKYLELGRSMDVYGDSVIKSQMPLWDGKEPGTVIMNMEGGFGDHFHCIRYAKDIVERGNTLIIAGLEPLAEIMRSVEGVGTFVAHQGVPYVYHNFWMPAMSAPFFMELEYSDVRGEPYIPRVCPSEGKIGVRWAGNPRFEHEQHRVFPKEMLWDVVEGFDVVSLQKNEETKESDGPDWMEKPSLETWDHTVKELSKCDLVITSCTGVAHLSGAMGIETWIIIPVLPYHLWALPGKKTVHYDSVTLFRQEEYGNWDKPFWEMKKEFRKRMWNKKETPEELYYQI
jgi:hypothetical protein